MISTTVADHLIPLAFDILAAVAIFFIGRYVARWLVRLIRRFLTQAGAERMIVDYASYIANILLMLFLAILIFDQLGLNTTYLLALFGAAGLSASLAFQDALKHIAGGIVLVVFRPFRAGDRIEAAGSIGHVEAISLYSTTLRTADNREVILPNASIAADKITNFSARPVRRIDMVFRIGYADDIRRAMAVIETTVKSDARVLADPPVDINVAGLSDHGVDINVRPWVLTEDHGPTERELTEKIKLAFDQNGISVPYPQLQIHWDQPSAPTSGQNSGLSTPATGEAAQQT